MLKLFYKRKVVVWTDSLPIKTQGEETDHNETIQSDAVTPTSVTKIKFPVSSLPDLIKLVHGNTKSRVTLVKKFLAFWVKDHGADGHLPKSSISNKIREIATWQEYPEEGPFLGRNCWYVKKEFREMYDLLHLSVPNMWKGNEVPAVENSAEKTSEVIEVESTKKRPASLITKFTKVLSEDERKKQLKVKRFVFVRCVYLMVMGILCTYFFLISRGIFNAH